MLNIRPRLAGLAPFGLKKTAAWLHCHLLAVELLALAGIAGLLALELLP